MPFKNSKNVHKLLINTLNQPNCMYQLYFKEKQFFYPTTFENLEAILRNNFNAVPNLDDNPNSHHNIQQKVKFYDSSEKANDVYKGK